MKDFDRENKMTKIKLKKLWRKNIPKSSWSWWKKIKKESKNLVNSKQFKDWDKKIGKIKEN